MSLMGRPKVKRKLHIAYVIGVFPKTEILGLPNTNYPLYDCGVQEVPDDDLPRNCSEDVDSSIPGNPL